MATNKERREIARKLSEVDMDDFSSYSEQHETIETILGCWCGCEHEDQQLNERLADLIDPDTSSFYDAEWRRWYEGLCHSDGDDNPESLRDVLEDIVWAVLTIDLGPNGNVDCGIDEGIVQTEALFDFWEREIRGIMGQELVVPDVKWNGPDLPGYVYVSTEAGVMKYLPERTCRMIDNGCELCCSECDRRHQYDDEPDYCMGCGAKVVEE